MLDAADVVSGGNGPGARRRGLTVDAGPLIGLRVSLSRSVWRIGPAWAVLAGAVAGGAPIVGGPALLRLLSAVALADCAWGAVWWLTAAGAANSPPEHGWTMALPYIHLDAPLVHLTRGLRHLVSPGAHWHELIAGLALMTVLSVLLGGPALILSLVALLVILWGWVLAQRDLRPCLCHALLNVGLPWVLGTLLAGQGASLALSGRQIQALWLAAAFTILQWGVQRAHLVENLSRARGIWLGQAALIAVLVGLRQPVVLTSVAGLLLPPTWWLSRARQSDVGFTGALTRSAVWWWGALVVAALALA